MAVPQDATEYLISTHPLVVRRRVLWGECDPAGVVYTPRFADYAASARDFWFRHVLHHSDRPHPSRKQITFPMRAMQFDFRSMIAADDVFDMTVSLAEVRTRSFTLQIVATHPDSRPAFLANLSQVAFDQEQGAAVLLPASIRQTLAALGS